jgi:hypothetical protein
MSEVECCRKPRGAGPNTSNRGLAGLGCCSSSIKPVSHHLSCPQRSNSTHPIKTNTEANHILNSNNCNKSTTTTEMKAFTALSLAIATLAAATPSPNSKASTPAGCEYSCLCQRFGPGEPEVDPDTARCCSSVGGVDVRRVPVHVAADLFGDLALRFMPVS